MQHPAKLPSWWPYAAVFMFALVVRTIYLIEIRDSDVFWILVGDGFVYETWALQINQDWVGKEIFYQAPLYPYFLASVYLLISDDTLTVRAIQFLLGAVSCVLLARAGRSFFSRRAGIIAGLLLAIYAPTLFFEGIVQKAVFDVFFVTLMLFALGRLQEDGRRRWCVIAGLALGCLSLTRENALLLFPIILIWIVIRFWKHSNEHRNAELAILFFLGLSFALGPVLIRNIWVGGEFVVTTSQFGPNFYIGNNPKADGSYRPLAWGRGSALLERLDAVTLAENAAGRKLSASEVSSYWTGKAVEYIRANPGDWLKLLGRKWLLFWNAEEISDSEEPVVYMDESTLLRNSWTVFHFGVLCPLALVGFLATWDQRRRLWLLYLMIFAVAAGTVLFFVFARYRMPVVPILILFASAGILAIVSAIRERKCRQLVLFGIALAVAALVVNWRLNPKADSRALAYYNMAVSLEMQGNEDIAIAYYARALHRYPRLVAAHFNRGLLLSKRGHFEEAAVHFRHAAQLRPDDPAAHCQLANALLALGRPEEAAGEFRAALRINPNLPQVKASLEKTQKELDARKSTIQNPKCDELPSPDCR